MQLSDSSRTFYDRLCPAQLPACRLFYEPLQELFQALEVSKDDISRHVGLVLYDPLCNTRRVQGQENAEYVRLSIGYMKYLVDLLTKLMNPGGHGQMFCSALDFRSWSKLLCGLLEVVNTIDHDMGAVNT